VPPGGVAVVIGSVVSGGVHGKNVSGFPVGANPE